jgi:hypothetical protein
VRNIPGLRTEQGRLAAPIGDWQIRGLGTGATGVAVADIPPELADALKDRYRIERELGRGGTATVYLADDTKHKRYVALKVLRPSWPLAAGLRTLVNRGTSPQIEFNLHPHWPLHFRPQLAFDPDFDTGWLR